MPHVPPKNRPTIGFLPLLRYPKIAAGAPSVAQGGQAHQQGETTTLHLGLWEKLYTMTASRSGRDPMEMPEKPRRKSPNHWKTIGKWWFNGI